ncbi:MAG: hypothetical protein PHX30_03445 [Candidatus Pacebacteria bacterium]|nr:hypothetical protein [Candidatus Paceibacterota bacterium]
MKSFEFDSIHKLITTKENGHKETEKTKKDPNIDTPETMNEGEKNEIEQDEDDEFEIEHRPYETPAVREDIDKFVTDLDCKLKEKAISFGITNEEGLEHFRQQAFELANLEMKYIDGQTFIRELEELKLNRGDLEFISASILDAVDDIHQNLEGKLVGEHFSFTQKALEFVGKHKRVFNLGALALYLSTFGSGVLKAMSGDQAKIIIDYDETREKDYMANSLHLPVAEDGNHTTENNLEMTEQENYIENLGSDETLAAFEKFEEENRKDGYQESSIGQITTAQLMENPELITLIDNHRDLNSPMNILEQVSPAGEFSHGDVHFSFVMREDNDVYLENLSADDNSSILRLDQTLQEKYGIPIRELGTQGIPLKMFADEEENLVEIFSKELDIPAAKLMTYADHIILPDTSQIEIVKFEDFHIPIDEDTPEMSRLKEMKENIYAKHGLDIFGQIVVDKELSKEVQNITTNEDSIVDYTTQEARESFLHHNQEERLAAAEAELQQRLEADGDSTGYDNYDILLSRASQDSNTSQLKAKIASLGINEVHADDYENSEEFQEMFLKALADDGFPLPELEKIAQKDPKKVIEIVSQTVGKHVNYSNLESTEINRGTAYTNMDALHLKLRHQSLPAATLGAGAGICHDYAPTMAAGLDVLEQLEIPHMDNLLIMQTTLKGEHTYVLLATYENDAIRISLVDPTFADSGSDLDAVDNIHSYHGVSPEIYKAQKEILERQVEEKDEAIKNFHQTMAAHEEIQRRIELKNFFAFQQRIVDFITKYFPKETRGRKIQVDENSYRAIQKHEQKLTEMRKKINEADTDNN